MRTKEVAQVKFDPATALALKDIALWSTSLTRGDVEYTPGRHLQTGTWQMMRGVKPEMLSVEFNDGESANVLRAIVSMGVRFVEESQEAVADPDGNEPVGCLVLFTLEASFAVQYECLDDQPSPTQEEFNDFVNFNCVHNAWPFWRQHVFDTLKRASLPVPEVPFFAGRASSR